MRTLLLTILIAVSIGCTKKDTPQPTTTTHTAHTPTPYDYLTDGFIDSNLIGNYNIYKETHIGNDTTHHHYPAPMDVIYITSTTIQYNPPSTPVSYTYNNYTITSSSYNYIVIDMSEDTNWIYLEVIGGSYITGFNKMFISLSRI